MSQFIIPVFVKEEHDLYSQFDTSGLTFSGAFLDYLTDCNEDRKPGEKVILEIHSQTSLDIERIKKAFHLYLEKLNRRNKRDIRRNQTNAFRLLFIGIAFVVSGILLSSHIKEVLAFIISTIGSFSIWEAAALWIETLPVLRKKAKVLKMLSHTEFRCIRSETSET